MAGKRTLIDGRCVTEYRELFNLNIHTHSPGKWLAVDLESGEVWRREMFTDTTAWRVASASDLNALALVVSRRQDKMQQKEKDIAELVKRKAEELRQELEVILADEV